MARTISAETATHYPTEWDLCCPNCGGRGYTHSYVRDALTGKAIGDEYTACDCPAGDDWLADDDWRGDAA